MCFALSSRAEPSLRPRNTSIVEVVTEVVQVVAEVAAVDVLEEAVQEAIEEAVVEAIEAVEAEAVEAHVEIVPLISNASVAWRGLLGRLDGRGGDGQVSIFEHEIVPLISNICVEVRLDRAGRWDGAAGAADDR
jgi:hypothetical protein